jgi:hypothetical protein
VQIKFPTADNDCIVLERGENTVHNDVNSIKIPFGTEITTAGAIVIHT